MFHAYEQRSSLFIFSWLQHVMKFADTVKEVQVQHPSSNVRNPFFPVGRRRANQVSLYITNFHKSYL
jgi:hypothetical protein